LFAKSFQKPDSDQPPFFGNMREPREAWQLKKTAKVMELVINTRNSANGTQISIGKFSPGKRDYLFRSSTFSENFPVGRTKKVVFHLHPNRNFWNFLVNAKRPLSRFLSFPENILVGSWQLSLSLYSFKLASSI